MPTIRPGLVLSRRVGEVIMVETGPPLNQVLYISVVRVDRGAVRLGVNNPAGWNVKRGEQDGVMLQSRLEMVESRGPGNT